MDLNEMRVERERLDKEIEAAEAKVRDAHNGRMRDLEYALCELANREGWDVFCDLRKNEHIMTIGSKEINRLVKVSTWYQEDPEGRGWTIPYGTMVEVEETASGVRCSFNEVPPAEVIAAMILVWHGMGSPKG